MIASPGTEILRDGRFLTTNFPDRSDVPALLHVRSADFLERATTARNAAAVLTTPEMAGAVPEHLGLAVAADPEAAFIEVHNRLARTHGMAVSVAHEIHPSARIHPSAVVEEGVRIGPGVEIGANAVIHRGTILEEEVVIEPGALIGIAGNYRRLRGGRALRADQVGGVRIGPRTVIMGGAVVHRAAFVEFSGTGADCTLLAGALIGHGSVIGDRTELALRALVCGFSRIGNDVWIGPGAVVSNLLTIGDGARVEIGAVVVRSIPAGARYSGLFARPHARMRAISKAIAALDD